MQKEVVLQRAGIIIFQVCVCNALLSLSPLLFSRVPLAQHDEFPTQNV